MALRLASLLTKLVEHPKKLVFLQILSGVRKVKCLIIGTPRKVFVCDRVSPSLAGLEFAVWLSLSRPLDILPLFV